MDKVGEQTLEVMSSATWYNNWLLQMSERYLGRKVLEIGSGIGNFTKFIKKGRDVYATDINGDYLRILKHEHKDVDSGYGDIEKNKFFFKKEKFDSIIAFNVLEHINDDQKAINNAYNLLKKNGKFIIIVPAHELLFSKFDKNLGHFRRYNIERLSKKIKKSGFKIVNLRYINWVSAIGWFFFVKLMNRSQMPAKEVRIFDNIGPILISIEKYIKFPFGLSVYCVAEK